MQKKIIFYFYLNFYLFLVVVAGMEGENFFSIVNFQFSVFNPQNPQNPQNPRAPRASRAKPREEEGFFGLVPLVLSKAY
jgi:hypothetical protein